MSQLIFVPYSLLPLIWYAICLCFRYLNIDPFKKNKIQILKKVHLGFLESFDVLFLVLQANYGEKISVLQIFSLVGPNMT